MIKGDRMNIKFCIIFLFSLVLCSANASKVEQSACELDFIFNETMLNGQRVLILSFESEKKEDVDSYQIDLGFHPEELEILNAAIDAPLLGYENFLKISDAPVIPLISKGKGEIQIAATRTGNKQHISKLNGIAGIVLLKVKEKVTSNTVSIKIKKVKVLQSNKVACTSRYPQNMEIGN